MAADGITSADGDGRAKILDGRALAKQVRRALRSDVKQLSERGVVPQLSVFLVGDDPASAIYVRNKGRAAARVGVPAGVMVDLPGTKIRVGTFRQGDAVVLEPGATVKLFNGRSGGTAHRQSRL